jgi:hypothetical protein
MPRPKDDLTKHTIRLRRGDTEFLDERFPKLRHNVVIRQLVAQFVDKIERQQSNGEPTLTEEIDV